MIHLDVLISEVERELVMRRALYPGWKEKAPTEAKKRAFDLQMQRMEGVAALLQAMKQMVAAANDPSHEHYADACAGLVRLGFNTCDRCEEMRLDVEERSSADAPLPYRIMLCEPCFDAAQERQAGMS